MTAITEDLNKAENYYNKGDYASAYKYYLSLAQGGHADSQVFIGWMLLNGIGINKDTNKAAYWFERAASLGSVRGAFYFGRFLTSKEQHKEALKW